MCDGHLSVMIDTNSAHTHTHMHTVCVCVCMCVCVCVCVCMCVCILPILVCLSDIRKALTVNANM